ncbi:MAG: family 10 glycosylhydrolase, partial [Clostridia bacterium]|nr:family 10 glycosylhydrolase [Clostridia bacterium]
MPMKNMKCLWISQFDLSPVYTDGNGQRDVSEFVRLVDRMLFRVAECGFDTVFLQMRPNADSMYPSALYPPSHYVVGAYGNAFDYDPIELFLQAAHRHGISVHAWINPLRYFSEEERRELVGDYPILRLCHEAIGGNDYVSLVNG